MGDWPWFLIVRILELFDGSNRHACSCIQSMVSSLFAMYMLPVLVYHAKCYFQLVLIEKTQSWLYVVNLGHCISSLPKGLLSLFFFSVSLAKSGTDKLVVVVVFFVSFCAECLLLNYQCYFNAEIVNSYLCMLKPCASILFK